MKILIFTVIALLITVTGIILTVMAVRKISRCSKKTEGRIIDIQRKPGSGDSSLKARYSYSVSGKDYEESTGWVNYGWYSVGGECSVRYNEKKPEESYIRCSGYVIRMFVGVALAAAGIAAVIIVLMLRNSF